MQITVPDGTLTRSIHSPNFATDNDPTTALLVPVVDIGDTLVLQGADNVFVRLYYALHEMAKAANP